MERDKAYKAWLWSGRSEVAKSVQDAFTAGWEAAIQEFVVKPIADKEPWGTLAGAERYLEAKDREAFMILRRETKALVDRGQDPGKWKMIQDLQSYWIGYGEAWSEVHKLLPPTQETLPTPAEQASISGE